MSSGHHSVPIASFFFILKAVPCVENEAISCTLSDALLFLPSPGSQNDCRIQADPWP